MPPPSVDQDNSPCPFQTGENHRGPDALEPTIPPRDVADTSAFQAITSKSEHGLAETGASTSKSQHDLAETDDSLRIAQEVEQQQTGLIIIPGPLCRQQYCIHKGRICNVDHKQTPINCSPLNTVFVNPPVRMRRNAVFT